MVGIRISTDLLKVQTYPKVSSKCVHVFPSVIVVTVNLMDLVSLRRQTSGHACEGGSGLEDLTYKLESWTKGRGSELGTSIHLSAS